MSRAPPRDRPPGIVPDCGRKILLLERGELRLGGTCGRTGIGEDDFELTGIGGAARGVVALRAGQRRGRRREALQRYASRQ